jgi:hypothetical protein
MTAARTIGLGGITVGASYFDHDHSNSTGYTLGAEHSLGRLTPGIVYTVEEYDAVDSKAAQESGLVIGASYAVGGGLLGFLEYMKIEKDGRVKTSDEDTLLIGGLRLDF